MKKKKVKGPVTAEEVIATLQKNPELMRQREVRGSRQKLLQQRFAEAERPLVEALNHSGISAQSVWDLVNSAESYPLAIPILVAHLAHSYPFRIREGIARALTVKYAGEVAYRALVDQFRQLSDSADAAQHGFKWALGNAISVVAGSNHFNEVLELIRDRRHGATRDMMTLRLAELDADRAAVPLIELLADDEIAGYAIMALGKLRVNGARPYIEPFLAHPKPWVRQEANKALVRLGSGTR